MKDVTKLLESAGLAIKALTKNTFSNPGETDTQVLPVQQQKENFTAATAKYFSLLSSIDVRLRRQIYALEEAEIIPAETTSKDSQMDQNDPSAAPGFDGSQNMLSTKQTGATKQASKGTGQSNLDIGWLNARNDKVGKEMEAELWAEAKNFVQTLEEQKVKASKADATVSKTGG